MPPAQGIGDRPVTWQCNRTKNLRVDRPQPAVGPAVRVQLSLAAVPDRDGSGQRT